MGLPAPNWKHRGKKHQSIRNWFHLPDVMTELLYFTFTSGQLAKTLSLLSHCFYWDPSADQFSSCERSRFASSFPASRNIILANPCSIQSGVLLHFSQISGKLEILFKITSIYIPSEESLSFFGSVFQRSIKTTCWCGISTRTCP